jgi:hypothetical protein
VTLAFDIAVGVADLVTLVAAPTGPSLTMAAGRVTPPP